MKVVINPKYRKGGSSEFTIYIEFIESIRYAAIESNSILLTEFEDENESLDFDVDTIVNWACAWNKITNVGRTVEIIGYTNDMAYVKFEDDDASIIFKPKLSNIYRIEDLEQ